MCFARVVTSKIVFLSHPYIGSDGTDSPTFQRNFIRERNLIGIHNAEKEHNLMLLGIKIENISDIFIWYNRRMEIDIFMPKIIIDGYEQTILRLYCGPPNTDSIMLDIKSAPSYRIEMTLEGEIIDKY